MPINIIKPGTHNHFNAMVIGRPGIGKTSLLRTIPPDEIALVLSAESGLLCVSDMIDAEQVTALDIAGIPDVLEVLSAVKTKEWMDAYQWIFVDSLSEISTMCLRYAQKKVPDKSDAFPMWAFYEKTMSTIVRGFRDLPHYNVVITCLEAEKINDLKQRFIGPDVLHSKFASRLTSIPDEVFYMTTDQDGKRRVLLTQPGMFTPGKDRSGKLAAIEAPDLTTIRNKILGKETK